MKKQVMLFSLAILGSASVFAADALDGTQWKTIDDTTGKPKALVEFTEQSNGTLTASIKQTLDPKGITVCNKCSGAQKGKPLVGLTIVTNLKPVAGGKYEGGTILDPKSGNTYSLKGSLASNGQKLELRGYKGISALGRNQTWHRVK